MKATAKEILNNKSNKMVDLILDEIKHGGSKTITAGFTDDKADMNYVLTVGITVTDLDIDPQGAIGCICDNCSCNMGQSDVPEIPDITPDTTPDTNNNG